MSGTYAELHHEHQGKSSDKWESYLGTYERLFAPIRDTPVNIVEIGVQNGGSLEVLGKYFRNAANIIGCDINPLCADLKYDDARISVIDFLVWAAFLPLLAGVYSRVRISPST